VATGAALSLILGEGVSSHGPGFRAVVGLKGTNMEPRTDKEKPGIAVSPSPPDVGLIHGRGTVAAATRTVKARKHARAVFGTARAIDLAVRNGKSSLGSGPVAPLTGKMSLLVVIPATACGAAAIRHSSGRRNAVMNTRVMMHGSAETAGGLVVVKNIETD